MIQGGTIDNIRIFFLKFSHSSSSSSSPFPIQAGYPFLATGQSLSKLLIGVRLTRAWILFFYDLMPLETERHTK